MFSGGSKWNIGKKSIKHWDNRNRNRDFLFLAEHEEAVEENPELIIDIGESYQTPDQLGDLLVTLSLLPESRWKSLTCIDLIKVWYLNPYSPNVTFLYPLKTSENQRFSDVFRGYRNVTLGEYGLIWMHFYLVYQ